ncbi:MAG TPA: recombinase family protein [Solirubrobacterales bacterium]|nr:recombinase family protein [Solirubrobacterales bacterium]
MAARAAIGIIRVSERKQRGKKPGREESFVSPHDQLSRIKETCKRQGLTLKSTVDEIDVSGGKPLEERHGLREAIEAIEAGKASVLIVGYFDRLVRSLRVQGEVVSRVEAAGGEVLAVDYGAVSEKTAAQWLSGTMMGAFAEYYRRSVGERTAEAQADAVARGICPFPDVPPGLETGEDGRLIHTPDAPTVLEAFERRDKGATIKEIRAFLREHGIERSYHGVQSLLSSRLYLGEIHFGKLTNLEAHKPIVPRPLFDRVQRSKVSRGRRPKSDRLLARLGVLRCGSCGARMVIGTQKQNGRTYPFYRCPPVGDCRRRVTISAEIVEAAVVEATKERLANEEGRASSQEDALEAAAAHEKAQADLDAAIRAFAGFEDEEAARERLAELREARDQARDRDEQLRNASSALTITMADWDRLGLDAQRGLIRATVEAVTIGGEGRGRDRITIKLFGE